MKQGHNDAPRMIGRSDEQWARHYQQRDAHEQREQIRAELTADLRSEIAALQAQYQADLAAWYAANDWMWQ